jgi:hypothetical protein
MSTSTLYVVLHRTSKLFRTSTGDWTANLNEAELHSLGSAYATTVRLPNTVLREHAEFA